MISSMAIQRGDVPAQPVSGQNGKPDDVFIVVGHDHTGRLAPAKHPFEHPTEAGAIVEAERLAAEHIGQRFSVFARVGVAIVERPSSFRKTQFKENAEIPF